MKKLAILLLMTGVVLAQPSMEKPDRNRLEMMKMWKLTDELELTEEQAEKFFPQYRTLMSDLENVTKQQHEVMKQIGELSKEKEVDGKKLDNLVKQANDFEKKKIDLKYNFFKEAGKVLTPEQQARHVIFEQQFRKQLKKGIREHGKRGKEKDKRRDRKRGSRGRGRGGF